MPSHRNRRSRRCPSPTRRCGGYVLAWHVSNLENQGTMPPSFARWESRQNAASCDRVFGGGMRVGAREIAVAAAGFCAFLNLYSPQALLPALSREFGAGPAEISAIMTASTLAIALTAPFTGALADVLGRKRIITTAMVAVVVPMAGAALAADVPALFVWRFLQGLLLPPIFAVVIAYIGDEWPSAQVAK